MSFGREEADLVDRRLRARLHRDDRLVLGEGAVDHAHVGDDAAVLVELRVEDQRPRRSLAIALGRWNASDDRFQDLAHAGAGLRRDPQDVVRLAADQVADLSGDPIRLGARQIDLVHHRDQLEPGLHRGVGVGDGLCLDALSRVDDQQRALAGGEATRDLVGEVDVARCVDQMQVVGLAIVGGVGDPHGLCLDRDPALALEVHRVEHLRHVIAWRDGPRQLEDAVGESRLAVVDVGDDREVSNAVHGSTSMAMGIGRGDFALCRNKSHAPFARRASYFRSLLQQRQRVDRRAIGIAALANLEVQVDAPAGAGAAHRADPLSGVDLRPRCL